MPIEYVYAILSVILVSLVSFVGVLTLAIKEESLNRMIFVLVSLAAGAMFGDAFIHILPETFKGNDEKITYSLLILLGIFLFFILEKFLRWRHEHTVLECKDEKHAHPAVGYINLTTEGVHNLIDGMLIGSSYLISIPIGITTTIAVVLHEIPQELGDFGILIHAGFAKTKALFFNFLSASLAIIGALFVLFLGANMESFSKFMLPFTAGGFIYIAGSDLLPELHKEIKPSKSAVQFLAMLLGAGIMLILV